MHSELDARAIRSGLVAALLVVAGILAGSRGLRHFDPALVAYASASVFAAFGIVYRYAVWLQRPPTALYWRSGWRLFLRPSRLPANLVAFVGLVWRAIVAQTFIDRRSRLRWGAHVLISWGTLVACMVTFPLVFGWVHFEADPSSPDLYRAFLFGFPTGAFPSTSIVGWLTFHVLDFCAVAIIAGMALAMRRRLYDPGALSVQQFTMDFVPLILLFSICVTGLMLTASSLWMHGHSYSFLAILHAFSVIVTLLYLPFGKFFHIFQRPANLGVWYYKQEGDRGEPARCVRCGEEYASALQVADLQKVLDELGLNQRMATGGRAPAAGETHYQEVCPACRRRLIAVNQLEAIGGDGFL